MIEVVLIIHLFLAIALVGIVLVQRSEGGALGMGGGTMGGLMTTRGSANLLTRVTGIIAVCFIATSLILAILTASTNTGNSIMESPEGSSVKIPGTAPEKSGLPVVPVAK